MNKFDQKPEWQTRDWWTQTLGTYRDERIDDITRRSTRSAYMSYITLALLCGGYLIIYGDWTGYVAVGSAGLSLGLLSMARWPLNRPLEDEYADYRFTRQFLFHVGVFFFIGLVFFLGTLLLTPDYLDRIIAWSILFTIPVFVNVGQQFKFQAYPSRTVIITILAGIGGAIVGALFVFGVIPIWGLMLFVGIFLIAMIASGYFSFKNRPW